MTETQTITLTNIQMLQQSYPGFEELLLTGILSSVELFDAAFVGLFGSDFTG